MRFVLLFLYLWSFNSLFSQHAIAIGDSSKSDVYYLTFTSDSVSPALIKQLNHDYGYLQTKLNQFDEAPGFYESNGPNTTREKLRAIKDIESGRFRGALASVNYEIKYNQNYLLCISSIVVPEGKARVSNSLHSEYPFEFTAIYNTLKGTPITRLAGFLTHEGVSYILKTLQQVMYKRAVLLYAGKDEKTEEPCRIWKTSVEMFRVGKYAVSNAEEDNNIFNQSDTNFYHFGFNDLGMFLSCNELVHQGIICMGPKEEVDIPWADLLPYCIQKPDNVIWDICKLEAKAPEKKDWTVKSPFTDLLEIPDEYSRMPEDTIIKPIKPYILKGDKVTALYQTGGYVKVTYTSPGGKEISGWVDLSDLE